MQTLNFHSAVDGLLAHEGVVLALGTALTVIWLVAALVSALRRKAK
jgi:hypothetical protein